ncbi:MAG: cell division protein FtsZ, partial [Candidatus Saccharibacteria bacterium]
NTDKAHLRRINAEKRLLIGSQMTGGLGAGGIPEVGEACMENALEPLNDILADADLVFITAGMGGGTGTGVAPVVARQARRQGSLVISMATTPFDFERGRRMEAAHQGIRKLNENSDMMLLLDNNRLIDIVNHLPIEQGFGVMDQLVSEMIKGLVEAVTMPSLVNLDFADLKTIMRHKGVSTILYGESTDPAMAVSEALGNPLLEVDYQGATGALIHVTGGEKFTIKKANMVLKGMGEQLDPDAQMIFGARVDPECRDLIRVMAVITGIKEIPARKKSRSEEREELDDALEELVAQCRRR